MRFFEWDFDAGIVTEFERHGECKRCGVCCQARVNFQVGKPYFGNARHGGKAATWKGVWQGVRVGRWDYFWSLGSIEPGKDCCPALQADGLCSEHEEKENICKLWPMSPRCVEPFPNCGYSFTVKEAWPIEDAES